MDENDTKPPQLLRKASSCKDLLELSTEKGNMAQLRWSNNEAVARMEDVSFVDMSAETRKMLRIS